MILFFNHKYCNFNCLNITIVIQSQSCIVDKVRVPDRVKLNKDPSESFLVSHLDSQLV